MRFNMNNKALSVIVMGVFFEKFSRALFISIPNSFSFEAELCLFRFPALFNKSLTHSLCGYKIVV